jgi:hypothetical protein
LRDVIARWIAPRVAGVSASGLSIVKSEVVPYLAGLQAR